MAADVRIAVVGCGLVGRRHVSAIQSLPSVRLGAIADPSVAAAQFAEQHNAPYFQSLDALLENMRPDGLIIATPNSLHRDDALKAINARLPILVEKPLAATLEEAEEIVAAAHVAGVAVATGHHRRHAPQIAAAKAVVGSGQLGTIVAVHTSFWLRKPDDYFGVPWRREPGGGPILINLTHDVDVLRHLVGDVVAVTARSANAGRGFAVEDTACVLLEFASGALGTLTLSDAVPSPWSWELTAGENPAYPRTDATYATIGGTSGALELPSCRVWSHAGAGGWWDPIGASVAPMEAGDALTRQIAQFAEVIRGNEAPLVSGEDGLETLRVVEAVKRSAESRQTVAVAARMRGSDGVVPPA